MNTENEGPYLMHVLFKAPSETVASFFAYVLQRANELFYFSRAYSDSELFEVYNNLMVQYSQLHDGSYTEEETAKNMKGFFQAKGKLTQEEIEEAEKGFSEADGMLSQTRYGNSSISLVKDEAGSVSIVLNVGVIEDDHSAQNHQEERSPSHPNSMEPAISPRDVINDMLRSMSETASQHPHFYVTILTRLFGLSQNDIKQAQDAIYVAIACIMRDSDYKEEPDWLDIVDFLYDFTGEALLALSDYTSEQNQLLFAEQIHSIPELEGILFLQRHLTGLATSKKVHTVPQPLSQESQWLLAYADFIEQTAYMLEGGIE